MNLDFKGLEAFVAGTIAECNVPSIGIAVVKGEETLYSKCFGYKDIENKLAPDGDTVYAMASLTKPMTAACAAMLVDEGKLDWDTPVINYLPEWRAFDECVTLGITLRDMLSHNTGLPRHDLVWFQLEGKSRTTKDLVESIRHLKPNKPARTMYEYNNLMFTSVGYIIERISGKTWGEFMEERLFAPLGMNNSSTVIAKLAGATNKALPYHESAKGIITKAEYLDFDGMGGCGTVNSTLNDMAKWASLNLNKGTYKGNTIISEKNIKEMQKAQTTMRIDPIPEVPLVAYGLGWAVRSYRGHYNINHSGGITGFSTYVTLLPFSDLGLVLLTNLAGTNAHIAIANTFIDHIMGLPEKDWVGHVNSEKDKALAELDKLNNAILADVNSGKPGAQMPHKMEDYTGRYEHKGYGAALVRLDGGKLFLSYNGFHRELYHSNFDAFYIDLSDNHVRSLIRARFVTDIKGVVSELQLDFERALNGEYITFTRAK